MSKRMPPDWSPPDWRDEVVLDLGTTRFVYLVGIVLLAIVVAIIVFA